jgi:hypothetical protein
LNKYKIYLKEMVGVYAHASKWEVERYVILFLMEWHVVVLIWWSDVSGFFSSSSYFSLFSP